MSWPTVLLVVLLTAAANSTLQPLRRYNEARLSEIAEFVATVVTNVTKQQEYEIVDCWFYTALTGTQPDTLLEQIIDQPDMRYTPIRIVKRESLQVFDARQPSVLVMDLRAIQQNKKKFPSLLYTVMKATKILAFVTESGFQEMMPVWKVFKKAAFFNVLFIRTDIRQNFYGIPYYVNNTVYVEEFPSSLKEMFPDHARNAHGSRIQASMMLSNHRARYVTDGTIVGPTIDWINITAQYVNATFSVDRIRCFNQDQCYQRMLYKHDGERYDLCVDMFAMNGLFHPDDYLVRSLASPAESIIAPRGRLLEVHEMFFAPFETEVWITIVALLITCILLSLLFPNQFHNELVMLVLCSFERTSLHRVKRLEKTVAIALIILFFVLLSAYESLFISMMTNQPRAKNPRTLNDLLEADIKIELPLAFMDVHAVELHPLIRNISHYKDDKLDGVSAYLEKRELLEMLLKFPQNFDYELGESKYVMIDWSSWETSDFFNFNPSNPLIQKFGFTQTMLDESGIMRKLEEQYQYKYYGSNARHRVMLHRFVPLNVVLDLNNLRPAWLVLALGLLIGMIGWVAEWGWFMGKKIYRGIL